MKKKEIKYVSVKFPNGTEILLTPQNIEIENGQLIQNKKQDNEVKSITVNNN
jgi:hypothetical protein